MILDRWGLLALISALIARLYIVPSALTDTVVLLAGAHLYFAHPPTALTVAIRRETTAR